MHLREIGGVDPDSTAREEARLASLDACSIMYTPREPALDSLVFTAAQLFRVPMASLSLVGRDSVWSKAFVGPLQMERPKNECVAPIVVGESKVVVIEDTTLDPRVSTIPMVQGDPRVRMIAAAPVYGPEHETIGALCVYDRVARSVPDRQRMYLQQLADQASEIIRLRVPGLDVSK